MTKNQSGLILVATPIGNLADITLRALNTLKEVDLIACEDTRHTKTLLSHHGITQKLISYNEHNAESSRPEIIRLLKEGMNIALVSDAGTPLISDPGYKLVRECIANAIDVTSLPGACSVINALCLSALPTDRFMFIGFLPPKSAARIKLLESYRWFTSPIIFLESPNRVIDSLKDLGQVMPQAEVAICREMTKLYEEVIRGNITHVIDVLSSKEKVMGEIVVVIHNQSSPESDIDIETALPELIAKMGINAATKELAKLTGKPRKEIYAIALAMKEV